MSNIYNPPLTLHQMVVDETAALGHLTPEIFLYALVFITAGMYVINREKSILCVAVTCAIYLLTLILNHVQ